MKKYRLVITLHGHDYPILAMEIEAADFEDAHTYAMAQVALLQPRYCSELFYRIEPLN